jgi:hypothetical protein
MATTALAISTKLGASPPAVAATVTAILLSNLGMALFGSIPGLADELRAAAPNEEINVRHRGEAVPAYIAIGLEGAPIPSQYPYLPYAAYLPYPTPPFYLPPYYAYEFYWGPPAGDSARRAHAAPAGYPPYHYGYPVLYRYYAAHYRAQHHPRHPR